MCVFAKGSLSVTLCSLCICLRMCIVQIVEYDDYDNTSDYYQVNEYEYEEEYYERYGPAEREREYILNAEVQSKQSHANNLWFILHIQECSVLVVTLSICPFTITLSLEYTRERAERRARLFGIGEENTHRLQKYTHTHTRNHRLYTEMCLLLNLCRAH